jgi:small subunit ribosomal protein S17e
MRTVDRIKRLSYEVLDQHKSKFGENFTDNKKLLDQFAIVRSKGLKNEVAGYITKFIKNEKREQEIKDAKSKSSIDESDLEETIEIETQPTPESEETVIEVGVDTPEAPEPNDAPEEKSE